MRIALFIAEYSGGGAERVMNTLAREFAAQGHQVDFLIGHLHGPGHLEDLPASVRVFDLQVKQTRQCLPQLVSYLRSSQPDVLLATLIHSCGMAVLARLLSGSRTKVILREANTISRDLQKYSWRKRVLLRTAVQLLYPLADAIIGISTGVTRDLAHLLPQSRHKIHLIYSPIITDDMLQKACEPLDHPWFKDTSVPVILSAGRLNRQKRFDLLIRAFARVRKKRPARLLILGEGELRNDLSALVNELGVSDDVILAGFDQNPFRHMARADVFVLSSDWEGLPGALIQALACGCPAVSTDCPSGPADILDNGRLGPLVPMGDAEALAGAIEGVLDGPPPKADAAHMERFTAQNSSRRYLQVMDTLMTGRGTGHRKLAYITAFIPYGRIESFILEESCGIKDVHPDFLIVPRNPPREVFHQRAKDLEANALWLPLFNAPIAASFGMSLFLPRTWAICAAIVRHSRGLPMTLKNFAVLPKALHVARVLERQGVGHVHAHWGATTATMAYVIHRMTGIPYSFTMHRWDIFENNMLREKIGQAVFARCISEKGKRDVLALAGADLSDKVRVIHMGVHMPEVVPPAAPRDRFVFLTPANLIPVKGHRYLIEACRELVAGGAPIQCLIAGDGPLEEQLKAMVDEYGLGDHVRFLGRLPHERIIEMYKQGGIDAVVLPSIDVGAGESEGIPVALIEAMSYGIPAIATQTGAIPELLEGGCGILVPEKDSHALAWSIKEFMGDQALYNRVRRCGREKVEREFDLVKISLMLISLYGL